MQYSELKRVFIAHEATRPEHHLTGHIIFTPDSFSEDYDERSRTYEVSSYNKAYRPNMGGYSIFGSCLDGSDSCARLESLMAEERGGANGWKVESCCLVDENEKGSEPASCNEPVE